MLETQLQPVAFLLKPTFTQLPVELASLPFPKEWYAPLMMLADERWPQRAGKSKTPPIDSLNRVLLTLVAHLLTAPQRSIVSSSDDKPWLLAYNQIPPDRIWKIVQAWVEKEFYQCHSLARVRKLIECEPLKWTNISIPLNEPPHPNSTARPHNLAFSSLPIWVADQLVARGLKISVYGESRYLVRVPTTSGAELMTWPPVLYQNKDQKGTFSYTVKVTVQTILGDPRPRLHFHYGIRRWVSQSLFGDNGKIRLGQMGRTVYLHSIQPWLGLPSTNSFTSSRLQARYEGGQRVVAWEDTVVDIVQRLQIPFPMAEALAKDPQLWHTGHLGVEAGIVEHSPRHHPINAGLGLEEHEQITAKIALLLEKECELCAPLTRATLRKSGKHLLNADIRDIPVEQRLTGLEQSIGPNLTIKILWATESGRDNLFDRLLATISRPRPHLMSDPAQTDAAKIHKSNGGKVSRIRAVEPPAPPAPEDFEMVLPNGGRLRIETQRIGEIGALLPEPDQSLRNSTEKGQYKRRRTEERVNEICSLHPIAVEPTLAIIELPNYQDPRQPLSSSLRMRDPKRALRLGFARRQVVTKFTTADNKDLVIRCEAAVRDGLRQMGYLAHPIGFDFTKGYALPKDLTVAGVWTLRLTKKRATVAVNLPVVVLFHTSQARIMAWVPDGKGVRPYYRMLLDVTTISPQEVTHTNKRERLKQLRSFLTNDIFKEGITDLAILASAQNARQMWPGLQNAKAAEDSLVWDTETEDAIEQLKGQVRLIRLRTYQENETPEWYVKGAGPGRGFVQGVWNMPDMPRTFYNNASKSKSMAKKFRGKQIDPREHYSLPSLLEICPLALQAGDNPLSWAHAVDQWRRMSNVTNEMTLLPLPLEFARKVDKYAEVIGPWVFPEEWKDEDLDEGDDETTDLE